MQELEGKSSGSSNISVDASRRRDGPLMPEYLTKAPCWSEKRDLSKNIPQHPHEDKFWGLSSNKSECDKKSRQYPLFIILFFINFLLKYVFIYINN